MYLGTPQAGGLDFDSTQLQSVLAGVQGPELTELLTAENLAPLLDTPGFFDALKPFLPEGQTSSISDLRANLRSPQYQQALSMFNAALKSGDLEAVMGQLGVDPALVRQVSVVHQSFCLQIHTLRVDLPYPLLLCFHLRLFLFFPFRSLTSASEMKRREI